ncbi:MAG: xylulose kinase, partial [Oscillospiraceae bacterium]|nr:xylulose kinase [Oscillospiraceae bacterium]
PDASVVGAAGLAAIGAGVYKNLDEVVENMVQFGETIAPIKENIETYNKIFKIYKDCYYGLKSKDVFTQLASL